MSEWCWKELLLSESLHGQMDPCHITGDPDFTLTSALDVIEAEHVTSGGRLQICNQ